MSYIILANEMAIEIEDEGSLGHEVHIEPAGASAEANALAIINALTPENVAHIEFVQAIGEEPYGVYDDVALAAAPTREVDEEGNIIITMAFRQKDEIEKRLDTMEEEITELQEAVIG